MKPRLLAGCCGVGGCKEIAEAIPPAYGEHIGRALMAELEARAAA